MSSDELYIRYHGFIVPTETHSSESLMFAQDFTFKDDDVVAATYPKSGQCFTPERVKVRSLKSNDTNLLRFNCPTLGCTFSVIPSVRSDMFTFLESVSDLNVSQITTDLVKLLKVLLNTALL